MIAATAKFAADYSYTYNYNTDPNLSGGMIVAALIGLVLLIAYVVLAVVAHWKIFSKAGKPGWAAIVPFYNLWVLAEVAGKPGWFGLLLLIPFVNIVIMLLIALGIAKNFGQSDAFGVIALWLLSYVGLSIIGYLILAFGSATYRGALATESTNDSGSPAEPPATLETPPADTAVKKTTPKPPKLVQ